MYRILEMLIFCDSLGIGTLSTAPPSAKEQTLPNQLKQQQHLQQVQGLPAGGTVVCTAPPVTPAASTSTSLGSVPMMAPILIAPQPVRGASPPTAPPTGLVTLGSAPGSHFTRLNNAQVTLHVIH